jgi:hypothetical protein
MKKVAIIQGHEFTLASIVGFHGTWYSGLARLIVKHEDGSTNAIPGDSGALGRALINAFDCAGEGHCIDNEKLEGHRIGYRTDDFGTLECFAAEAEVLEVADEIREEA